MYLLDPLISHGLAVATLNDVLHYSRLVCRMMHLEFIDVSGIAAPRGGVIYDTIRIHMHALKN